MDSFSSAPLSPIENTSRERWMVPNHIHVSGKETSESYHPEILTFSNRTQVYEEESKENINEHGIENIQMLMRTSNSTISTRVTLRNTNNRDLAGTEPSAFPIFSDHPSIETSPCITKDHQDLDDHLDASFQTQETVSDSDSDSDSEDTDSCVCISSGGGEDGCVGVVNIDTEDCCSRSSTASSSMCSKQSPSVHFADEVGLPIKSILHYECDRRQREHSELVVLCICPEKKTFEFLHVGYHRHQESNATVDDLLRGIPNMCTNSVFVHARFVALYRNNNKDRAFQNLCSPQAKQNGLAVNEATKCSNSESSHETYSLALQDCGFRENEVIVAAIHGSPERAVLAGISPLLRNKKILKTLKRARQSRRGLKFISGKNKSDNDKESQYHLQKRRNASLRRRLTEMKSKGLDKRHPNVLPNLETDFVDLVDEYCHDYDPLHDVAEYHKHVLLGLLVIGSGTLVFSALGL